MSLRLAGKAFVVEVTFPADAEVATALVEGGARVLAVAADEAAADAVAASLGDAGLALAVDLTTADGVNALGASVPIVLGRLDGAVLRCTGAGTGGAVAVVDDLTWRRACNLLVEAPARAVRELAPQLEGGGVIVLVEPPADGGATGVLLPALRALAAALDASLRPEVRFIIESGAADRDALLAALTG